MTVFFCIADGGFYPGAPYGDAVGKECVELSDTQYMELLSEIDQGKVITVVDGWPVAVSRASTLPPAEAQAQSWACIEAERDRRKLGGVQVGELWVHSDTFSRSQWLGLKDKARDVLAAGGSMTDMLTNSAGEVVAWKCLGAAFTPVTVQLTFDVVAAIADADMAIFRAAEVHRNKMIASEKPADYDCRAGWPQTYAEWIEHGEAQ